MSYSILKGIVSHRCDKTAIHKDDGFITTDRGKKRRIITVAGWEFLVQWNDGTMQWVPLKELKDSNPLEVMDYVYANDIQDHPAFAWWVGHVKRKKKALISKVKSKYWRINEKFGVKLPHSVKEAIDIDKRNGNTLWQDAINKELKNVKIAFTLWEHADNVTAKQLRDNYELLPTYQEIRYHFVFDVKMDFTRKARLVAGGHMTRPPDTDTYSSVVSRESVRIAFLTAQLLDLDVSCVDIGNAYLNAPCREKIWVEGGMEFGSEWEGKVLIITRALYGLKSSGAAWRSMLANTMRDLGYKASYADPDVWLRAAIKYDNEGKKYKYYEYCLIYVDDIICISHHTEIDRVEQVVQIQGKTWTTKEISRC